MASIEITSVGSDLQIVSYGSIATYPKGNINISLRPKFILIKDGTETVQTISNLSNTLPAAASFPELFVLIKGLVAVVAPSGGGGGITAESDPTVSAAAKGITSTQVTNWGAAFTNMHTHGNKAVLDLLTSQHLTDIGTNGTAITNLKAGSAETIASLKTAIDGLTTGKANASTMNAVLAVLGIDSSGNPTVDADAIIDTLSEMLVAFQTYSEGVNIATHFTNLTNSISAEVTRATAAEGTKEPSIALGTNAQYWRGDKTWQPFPAQGSVDFSTIKRVSYYEAQGNGTAMNSLGLAMTAQGTATSRNVSTTNAYSRLKRTGYVGATTADAPAGLIGSNFQCFSGNYYAMRSEFCLQVYNVAHRYTIGMGASIAHTSNYSTQFNRVQMFANPGDLTFKIVGANATTVGTVVELGPNFPCNTQGVDVYDVTFVCEIGATTVFYRVVRTTLNTNTGITETYTATGTVDMAPASTVLLQPQIVASNAASAVAASVDIMFVRLITDN